MPTEVVMVMVIGEATPLKVVNRIFEEHSKLRSVSRVILLASESSVSVRPSLGNTAVILDGTVFTVRSLIDTLGDSMSTDLLLLVDADVLVSQCAIDFLVRDRRLLGRDAKAYALSSFQATMLNERSRGYFPSSCASVFQDRYEAAVINFGAIRDKMLLDSSPFGAVRSLLDALSRINVSMENPCLQLSLLRFSPETSLPVELQSGPIAPSLLSGFQGMTVHAKGLDIFIDVCSSFICLLAFKMSDMWTWLSSGDVCVDDAKIRIDVRPICALFLRNSFPLFGPSGASVPAMMASFAFHATCLRPNRIPSAADRALGSFGASAEPTTRRCWMTRTWFSTVVSVLDTARLNN